MIKDHDRSLWIGASDTSYVMGNWKTETFSKWWLQKLGDNKDHIQTKAMKVGNAFEHKILDVMPRVLLKDDRISIPELWLRVNYDGTGYDYICEVKTSKNDYKLSKAHWQQAQVEMLAWIWLTGNIPDLEIAAYKVTEDEYRNYFTPINTDRIVILPVEYDESFAEKYLEKLKVLHECIEKGVKPC